MMSKGHTPKISVITINYNNATGLRRNIESVINQTFKGYEYIIIDGGSTDGSKEIIEEYHDRIDYWVSEADRGIYDAMNKGIQNSKGEYCVFINSSDFLYDEAVLKKIEPYLNLNKDIVYGNFLLVDSKNIEILKIPPNEINLDFMLASSLPHTSSFINRKLFDLYGLYNVENKIVSDWEFFLKVIVFHNVKTIYVDLIISVFDGNGVSNLPRYNSLMLEERERVKLNYFPIKVLDCISEKTKITKRYNRIRSNMIVKLLIKLHLIDE